jgi:hypothetical protein
MRRGRRLLLAGTFALITMLVTPAGAVAKQEGVNTSAQMLGASKVESYLRSIGIDPGGVVVQQGRRNYAGPNCPGRQWNCTKARAVVQVAAAGGQNEFECTGNATPSSSANPCVIVQEADGGDNVARCIQKFSQYGESQHQALVCDIRQVNTTGTNSATVRQTIWQRTDVGKQRAYERTGVEQVNGSGSNIVSGVQSVTQYAEAGASATQDQNASQSFNVDQDAETGSNNQSLRQLLDQNAVLKGNSPAGATSKPASQTQNALLEGVVDQDSTGVSLGDNRQRGTQQMDAPPKTKQVQDPRIRCCADQTGNPRDEFRIDQQFVQLASNPTSQYAEDVGECFTTGICTITQRARQNDAKKTNFVSGTGLVTASIVCRGYGEQNKCVAKSGVGGA